MLQKAEAVAVAKENAASAAAAAVREEAMVAAIVVMAEVVKVEDAKADQAVVALETSLAEAVKKERPAVLEDVKEVLVAIEDAGLN